MLNQKIFELPNTKNEGKNSVHLKLCKSWFSLFILRIHVYFDAIVIGAGLPETYGVVTSTVLLYPLSVFGLYHYSFLDV